MANLITMDQIQVSNLIIKKQQECKAKEHWIIEEVECK